MISTIFFDLDGTLIDQKTAQNEACLTLYRCYGFSTAVSEGDFIRKWDSLTEFHYDAYLRRECTYNEQRERRIVDLFAAYGIDRTGKEPLAIYDEYLYYFEKNWRPYPEVKECLEALKGYRLGILTNGDTTQQNQKLEATGLASYFFYVVCAGDYDYAKPDPRLFEAACQLAGVPVSDCLYVGDSFKSDIAPCLTLGMPCVFINRKNKKVEEGICAVPTCEAIPAIVAHLNGK